MSGTRSSRRIVQALVVSLLSSTGAAVAQDVPVVDAVGAYHHAQVMQHRDTTQAAPAKPPPQSALTRRQLEAITAKLRVEYGQRLRRDGKPAADRWLNARVAQLKTRYSHTSD